MTYMSACARACFYLRVRVRVRACISTRTSMFGCSNVVFTWICVFALFACCVRSPFRHNMLIFEMCVSLRAQFCHHFGVYMF